MKTIVAMGLVCMMAISCVACDKAQPKKKKCNRGSQPQVEQQEEAPKQGSGRARLSPMG